MATLLTNHTGVVRNVTINAGNSNDVSLNQNEFFFYSNSPETLDMSDIADNGKFLNRVNVSGTGQIYTWHNNNTGSAIKNCILIYNPNSYAVQVNVTNYGLTNGGGSDTAAWENYYNGQNTTVTVAAGGYNNLFLRTIADGNNFGVVARATIVRSGTSTPASVTLMDLAYINDSGSASSFADEDPTSTKRARGLGSGFYTSITFPTLIPTSSNCVGCTIASKEVVGVDNTYDDSFSGADCSYITDPSNKTTGPLQGGFGQQYYITIPIKNTTGITRKFRIVIGSRGGQHYPFVNFAGGIAYSGPYDYTKYVDVIETDMIADGSTTTISFSTVIPAMSNTPYYIGVRAV